MAIYLLGRVCLGDNRKHVWKNRKKYPLFVSPVKMSCIDIILRFTCPCQRARNKSIRCDRYFVICCISKDTSTEYSTIWVFLLMSELAV